MPLTQRSDKILKILNIFALVIILLFSVKEFASPFIAERLYKEKYKELMFQCDNVMRDHFIAKNEVITSPSSGAIKKLHAAEVGLLACHDYDVLRKKLLTFGLDENKLAQIGLEAIEERAKDVRTFVQTHEFRY